MDPNSWEARFKRSMRPQPPFGQQVRNTLRDLYPPQEEMDAAREARARMEQVAANRALAMRAAQMPRLQDPPMPSLLGPPDGGPEDRQIRGGLLAGSAPTPEDNPQERVVPQGDAIPQPQPMAARDPASAPAAPAASTAGDDEDRAIRSRAGYGGLLALGAGLMGYGQDTRNIQPLMQGVSGFQDALRGAMVERAQMERAKQQQAQTALTNAQAQKVQAQEQQILARQQAEAKFADSLAGAPGGQVAQGDGNAGSGGPLDMLTDMQKKTLLMIPDPKQRIDTFQKYMEANTLARNRIVQNNGEMYSVDPLTNKATLIPTAGGKPLDNQARDDLEKKVAPLHATMGLLNQFKPEFGGAKIPGTDIGSAKVGDLENWYGRNVAGDDTEIAKKAAWWQQYQQFANPARNQQFGSVLTPTEREEWDKAAINPGMTPGQIQTNLAMQRKIALSATSRIAHSVRAGGVNPDAIEPFIGMRFQDRAKPGEQALPDPMEFGRQTPTQQHQPPAQGGGPAHGQVIDGYRFKGGNPADKNSWERVQ